MKSLIDDVALNHVAIVITGHKQDVEIRIDLAQMVHQHGTAHSWHHHIHQEKIRSARETLEGLNRDLRTSRPDNFIAFFRED